MEKPPFLIPLQLQQMLIQWMPEDELPTMPGDFYEDMYFRSEIHEGIRVYPYLRVPSQNDAIYFFGTKACYRPPSPSPFTSSSTYAVTAGKTQSTP